MAQTFQSAVLDNIGGSNTPSYTFTNKAVLMGVYVVNKTKGDKGFSATLTRNGVTTQLFPWTRVSGQSGKELLETKLVILPGDIITTGAVAANTFAAYFSWLDGVS